MDNIIILSDDLTGANDSGVQFAKNGIPTVVCIDDSQSPDLSSEGIASVINVESRSLLSEEAYHKWIRLLELIDLDSFQIIFKKIDSTLRGNIGKEIQAFMDMGHFEAVIVAPAYPQKERITIGGYQLVHQHLLEDSEISKDPKFPVTESKVSEIIRRQLDQPIGEIDIRTLRSGDCLARMEDLMQEGISLFVFDSAAEEDLDKIVSELSGRKVLWVGSAGLAQALAKRYSKHDFETQLLPIGNDRNAPVLVMAGSVSEITFEQVENLKARGFQSILLDPLLLLGHFDPAQKEEKHREIEAITRMALQMAASGKHMVISTDVSKEKRDEVREYLQRLGISGIDGGEIIADGMGKMAAAVISHETLSGVVLTGGDIAYRTCKNLGIRYLRIVDEVEEGLPLCITVGPITIPLVTKAGAFGNRNSLLLAADAMINRSLTSAHSLGKTAYPII